MGAMLGLLALKNRAAGGVGVTPMGPILVALILGVVGLLFAVALIFRVVKADDGNDRMRSIGTAIREGSQAFLNREYMVLLPFIIIVSVGLWLLIDRYTHGDWIPRTAIALPGGRNLLSRCGIHRHERGRKGQRQNCRRRHEGPQPCAPRCIQQRGSHGLTVVGIGLLGVTILYVIFQDILWVTGFAFGASSIALFARVGGGIFTKAADVGADLVGKVEAGIPEDDPRNPAVIADNVGDNVGDVAGMGADLFESYVGSIIAA